MSSQLCGFGVWDYLAAAEEEVGGVEEGPK